MVGYHLTIRNWATGICECATVKTGEGPARTRVYWTNIIVFHWPYMMMCDTLLLVLWFFSSRHHHQWWHTEWCSNLAVKLRTWPAGSWHPEQPSEVHNTPSLAVASAVLQPQPGCIPPGTDVGAPPAWSAGSTPAASPGICSGTTSAAGGRAIPLPGDTSAWGARRTGAGFRSSLAAPAAPSPAQRCCSRPERGEWARERSSCRLLLSLFYCLVSMNCEEIDGWWW